MSVATGLSRQEDWTAQDEASRSSPHPHIGDGATDATAAIQRMLDTRHKVVLPAGVYLISGTLTVHPGCHLEGAGSGNYGQGASAPTVTELRVKSNTAATGVVVSSRGAVTDVLIRPENHTAVTYDAADYPTGTGNAAVGLHLGSGGGSASAHRVFVESFATGIRAETTSQIHECFAHRCDVGYGLVGADGQVAHSTAMFCHTAGMRATGNYWRYVSNRVEWNARYGIDAAGESTFVANLFDRNGWAGLRLRSGLWGHVVTGNYFSRNGVGGDGSVGRWGFSVPGHPSYVETITAKSCHITIDYQRGVSITGNRFRAGLDDSNSGANGPAYLFSSESANGATPASDVERVGNSGVTSSVKGYKVAVAGGTDTLLASALNA